MPATRCPVSRWLFALALTLAMAAPVAAAECEPSQDPSPPSDEATGIVFYNETQFAMRVFWSGFDGFLEPFSDWIQPGERAGYDTYVGHAWFVELNTYDGPVCGGPISAYGPDTCQMRILYESGIGYDAGFCDF